MFELKRQEADAVGYESCRYDALLDDYEPHARAAEVGQVLRDLRDQLVPLVEKIKGSNRTAPSEILARARAKGIGTKLNQLDGVLPFT